MKRFIVHAGLPKTGSTALQVFLARNQAALRRQSIEYFSLGEFLEGSAGKISSGNGFLVARSMLPDGDPNATLNPTMHLADLTRAIAASACETGILSSEYFADCDPGKLQTWVAALQKTGLNVQLMYFIRAQTQALSSMYVQYVKRSHCRETPEAYVTRTYRNVACLRHASFFKCMTGIFGAGQVLCQTYEDAQKLPGGVCESFIGIIGAQPLPLAPEQVNLGLSPAELTIMRELNKFRPHTRLSDQLIENKRQTGPTALGETYNMLPPDLVRDIDAYFAAENAEMAKLYFNRDTLFPATSLVNAPGNIGEFSATDLINVLGGLLVRYDERIAHLESNLARSRLQPLKRLVRRLTPRKIAASLASLF